MSGPTLAFKYLPKDGSFENAELKKFTFKYGATKAQITYRPHNTGNAIAWFPTVEAALNAKAELLAEFSTIPNLRRVVITMATLEELKSHLGKKARRLDVDGGTVPIVQQPTSTSKPVRWEDDESDDEIFPANVNLKPSTNFPSANDFNSGASMIVQ